MSSTPPGGFFVRNATTADIPTLSDLIAPLVQQRVLLGKERVMLYEAVQEFVVAQRGQDVVGCGALHVFWENLAEVRTLAVDPHHRGHGVGKALLNALEQRARQVGVKRIFCLTFEVDFFTAHGFREVAQPLVDQEVYGELVRSADEGVAEFLDLARVKPNTLGNSRMLKDLPAD